MHANGSPPSYERERFAVDSARWLRYELRLLSRAGPARAALAAAAVVLSSLAHAAAVAEARAAAHTRVKEEAGLAVMGSEGDYHCGLLR